MPQNTDRYGLSESDAKALCDRVLNLSKADHARVQVQSGWRGFTRTATNRVTTSGGSEDISVNITSVFDKRVASIGSNRLDDTALEETIRRSEQIARISPENPEYMPELGAQRYGTVESYYESTGNMAPEARASAMTYAIDQANETDTIAAGYMDVRAGSRALATSSGLFAYHPSTGVTSTLTVRTPDGLSSGWAGDQANDWKNIENERIGDDAVRKCLDWRNKTALDPGPYTVILEPTAVGMLMLRMTRAFDARRADEGRSYFSGASRGENRIGEKLFDSRVSIISDPSSRDAETAPYAGDGLQVNPQVWVGKGVLKSLNYSRYWAKQKDTAPISRPTNLIMLGGSSSVSDMIRSTRRGVLITRFWYIRGLNPRIISYTGLTRDGTFLIENGKLSRPVTNFRFNQSLAELLKNVEMIGPSVQVCASENSSVSTPIVVPALKVRAFQLASVSDAI